MLVQQSRIDEELRADAEEWASYQIAADALGARHASAMALEWAGRAAVHSVLVRDNAALTGCQLTLDSPRQYRSPLTQEPLIIGGPPGPSVRSGGWRPTARPAHDPLEAPADRYQAHDPQPRECGTSRSTALCPAAIRPCRHAGYDGARGNAAAAGWLPGPARAQADVPPRQPSCPHLAGSSAATARFVLLAVEAGFLVRFENGPGLITSAAAVLTGQHALGDRVVRWAEIGAGPFTGPPRAPAASVTPEHGHDVTVTAGMPVVEYGLPAAAGPVTTCPTSNTYDEYPNDGYTVRRTSPISTRNARRCTPVTTPCGTAPRPPEDPGRPLRWTEPIGRTSATPSFQLLRKESRSSLKSCSKRPTSPWGAPGTTFNVASFTSGADFSAAA